MRKPALCLLALIMLFSASATWAGTVYVPLVVDQTSNGHNLETVIRITNTSPTEDRAFNYLLITRNSDGTDRNEDDITEILLTPRSTFILTNLVNGTQAGMVEISAPSDIAVTARLEGTSAQSQPILGAEMPVITSSNAVTGGFNGVLQGWSRADLQRQTDFHLINLGQITANCTATIFDGNGSTLLNGFSFTQRPLSQSSFADVLSLINIVDRDEVVAVFNCDQAFYPFSTVHDLITGETLFIGPSGSGLSGLQPPGDGGLPPVEPGATVLQRPGTFHVPSPGNESHHIDINMPGNPEFKKIVLDMDFFHGGWHPISNDNHAIFWLNRGTRWRNNLFGYFNAFGPNANNVKLSTNADFGAGNIRAKTAGIALQSNNVYHVHFEYDVVADVYFAEISQNGQILARVVDNPTTNRIRTVENNWFVAFGHETGAVGPEVPTYDWQYQNLQVQWIP